jgi:WhiB family redox-sensing transcriptional regulator
MSSGAWQDRAACRNANPELFFAPDGERQPEREEREAKAKAICSGCTVSTACLEYALGVPSSQPTDGRRTNGKPQKYGTWGGLDEDERNGERRRRMRRAA